MEDVMKRAAVVVVALTWFAGTPVGAQKPVVEESAFADFRRPPATAEAMASQADAIVIAKYTGIARAVMRDMPPGVPPPDITTYTFEVLELVKVDSLVALPGERFEVEMLGGDRELTTRIRRIRIVGVNLLVPERTYLVFLKYSRDQDRLVLPWGPMSIYDVTDGRLRSLMSRSQPQDGKTRADCVDELRGRK